MSLPSVLITRPLSEAIDFAGDLEAALDVKSHVVPLLNIRPVTYGQGFDTAAYAPDRYDGVILTSVNAVRHFRRHIAAYTHLKAFCVGPRTAHFAREAGFTDIVVSPSGNADGLIDVLAGNTPYIVDRPPSSAAAGPQGDDLPDGPPDAVSDQPSADAPRKESGPRRYLYLCGQHVSRDIQALLEDKDPSAQVDTLVVYEAAEATYDRAVLEDYILGGEIDVLTIFSSRTSLILKDIILRERYQASLSTIKLLSISDSVVKCLQDLPWQDVRVASRPDREGMIALIAESI